MDGKKEKWRKEVLEKERKGMEIKIKIENKTDLPRCEAG